MKRKNNIHIDDFKEKIIILRNEEELNKVCAIIGENRVSINLRNFPMILYKDRGCFSISEITNENIERMKEEKFENLTVWELSSIEMGIC